MAPSNVKGKNHFQLLLDRLPMDHKARWFAGAALSAGEQAMASVMSTALVPAQFFFGYGDGTRCCALIRQWMRKSFVRRNPPSLSLCQKKSQRILMISLLIQQLYREILSVADENGGKLPNRVMFYCDEFGTMPPIHSAR